MFLLFCVIIVLIGGLIYVINSVDICLILIDRSQTYDKEWYF